MQHLATIWMILLETEPNNVLIKEGGCDVAVQCAVRESF